MDILVAVVFVGHSCAKYEEAEKAMDNGAVFVTHLFNAMGPVILRNYKCFVYDILHAVPS